MRKETLGGDMRRVVWKFAIPEGSGTEEAVEVEMPRGAYVIHAGVQVRLDSVMGQVQRLEVPCVWAVVDPEAPREVRRFRWVLTGGDIPRDKWGILNPIGTFLFDEGRFVLHLFGVN
jgi:hypothetical protein